MRNCVDGRQLLTVKREISTDGSKLSKSDEVKYHSVHHYAVEKTPITAQLWMQRTRDQNSQVPSSSSDQPVNSYVSKGVIAQHDSALTFLLDKTAKESRLTIRYKFSEDGNIKTISISKLFYIILGIGLTGLKSLKFVLMMIHASVNPSL